MKKNLFYLFTTGFLLFSGVVFNVLFFSHCKDDVKCPPGNLCVSGSDFTYQQEEGRAKIRFIARPNSVEYDQPLFINDLSQMGNYNRYDRFYGGGYFRIEPTDLNLLQLITIEVEFPESFSTDDLGNYYGNDFKLYYIKSGYWSLVNETTIDVEKRTVSANILKLGDYAVAAPKNPVIDEWWHLPEMGNYEYSHRMVLYKDGNGILTEVVNCDPEAVDPDWQLSTLQFKWKTQDSTITFYSHKPWQICGSTGETPANSTSFYNCGATSLNINDGTGFLWERH